MGQVLFGCGATCKFSQTAAELAMTQSTI